jgi:hypothetical protein
MKNIILLLFTTMVFSQGSPYLSISADLRNGIVGSKPTNNKPEADLLFRAGVISNKDLKVGVLYENFKSIGFQKYGFEIGNQIKFTNRLIIVPTIEVTIIVRENLNHLNAGLNAEIIYMLTDNLGISTIANYSTRTDLNYYYGGDNYKFSGYAGLIWRFNVYDN